MITGSADVLSRIQSLSTMNIDVSGASSTVTKQADLVLPQGVTLMNGSKAVSCRVVLEQVVVVAIPDVTVEIRGAASGWKVSLGTPSVSVLVSGTSSAIMGLQSSQVKAFIDVSQPPLADGTYPVLVDGLAQGVVSVSTTPLSIAADVQRGP
jgi:YbbR domain-containing protein